MKAPVADALNKPELGLKILLADSDAAAAQGLRVFLEQEGYRVMLATDGGEAVALFMREQPDVVLMDVFLPRMNGFEATAHIRTLSGDGFVPVIYMTALQNEAALAECASQGGNDFITKPCLPALLKAKIESFSQMRRLYYAVKSQRDELAQHNRWLRREYEIAEGVFAKVMHSSGLQSPNIKYLVSPQAVFNGDLLLAAYRPTGELHLLLGDFTGHGLSAAIGTIPVADIFNGMTAKGFPISEIVSEINQKLHRILPRGLFFAAALLELDTKNRKVSAWVGGVPDVLIYSAEKKALAGRFSSKRFPLGVIDTGQMDCQVESMEVQTGDRIFLYTDGLPEARNTQGEMFSQEALERCFHDGNEPGILFERILSQLEAFRGAQAQSDDVTLIEVAVDTAMVSPQLPAASLAPRPASAWSARFEFAHDTLKGYDPLPMMMQVLLETQRLHQHKQRIYMVLAELFLNALEHGLLGLESSLKEGPAGFSGYYKEKEARLANLDQGEIKVELRHKAEGNGGRLEIRVEDSGPGFDHVAHMCCLKENAGLHGRGILLVKSVCASLRYSSRGNIAQADYVWSNDAVN